MDAVAPSDAGRDAHRTRSGSNTSTITPLSKENRDRSNSNRSSAQPVDYVRDGAAAAHRRGLSGNLLNKLGFSNGKTTSPEPGAKVGGTLGGHRGEHNESGYQAQGQGSASAKAHDAEAAGRAAMSALATSRRSLTLPAVPMASLGSGLLATRSRKGSLRKNILRKGSMQRMETVLSPRMDSRMSNSTDRTDGSGITSPTSPDAGDVDDDYPTPRASYERDSGHVTAKGASSVAGGSRLLGVRDGGRPEPLQEVSSQSTSTSLSRSSTLKDNSTTDEDEKPPGSSSSNASSGLMLVSKRAPVAADSYFPLQLDAAQASLRRRPSPMKTSRLTKSSPLSAMPLDAASAGPLSPEAWDYGETEWWGWIILVATWISFVVGMGSCFGAWSWAWDVGETPYAPPELEDDPTLPIVGYYPALIVLTGVMAWVWVIIAWVGMKYFKHAKMSGEDR